MPHSEQSFGIEQLQYCGDRGTPRALTRDTPCLCTLFLALTNIRVRAIVRSTQLRRSGFTDFVALQSKVSV